jgi:hypothetical protein
MGRVKPRGALRRGIASIWHLAREQPAYAGLCLVAAAEAGINGYFGWVYFEDGGPGVSLMMATLLLGNEVVKWHAADGVGQAAEAGQPWRAVAWVLVALACLSISIPAHIGFIGMMRGDTAANREARADQGLATRQQLEQALAEQKRLGTQRPVDAVEAEVNRAVQKLAMAQFAP